MRPSSPVLASTQGQRSLYEAADTRQGILQVDCKDHLSHSHTKLITALVSTMDSIMLGSLGEVSLSAAALANQLSLS
jgi:hypothetical protein